MTHTILKIGVAARFSYPNPAREAIYGPKTYTCVEQDMLDYVSRAGAIPIMVPPLPEGQLQNLLSDLDGLLLQGGSDMAPSSYGEAPIQSPGWPGDPMRDVFELGVMKLAMQIGMPVLGICRGFQVMNVYFGGTLFQDLKTQRPDGYPHRQLDIYDRYAHGIDFVEGGLLHDLHVDQQDLKVNSVHHQGIKVLGEGLEVEAHCAEDGLIEAFYWTGAERGRVMGVQWHPEFFHHAPEGLIDADRVLRHWLGFCGQGR
jgi:putative glutamine amidotransferase